MNLLLEAHNEAEGFQALRYGTNISTRICVSVKPENEVLRFVKDTAEVSIAGKVFEPVPYASFSRVTAGGGAVADTMDIILDGRNIIDASQAHLSDILMRVIEYPLRGKAIQVGRLILDTDTYEAIALQPRFVGTIHSSPLSMEDGPNLTIKCVSFRNSAHRQTPWSHSDVSHQQRWPGDRAAKHMNDAVARGGEYPWNKTTSSGGGSRGSSGGGKFGRLINRMIQY